VHVFYRDKREFYELEELWNDAKATRYADAWLRSKDTIKKNKDRLREDNSAKQT
jgi:hypothetical protein